MAIYRGTGGASDSTDDSTISAVTTQAGIATTKASEAASSAIDANTSATNAAASATAASGYASTSSDNATASSGSATDAAGFATAASNSATAASTSATAAANSASIANSAEVQAVAAKTTEITGVYNDIANVNTVAGNITDVNTVATNSSNITAVAGDASDIGTVATSISNVNTVGDNIASVNAVASNNTNINTVAADASDIGTVAGISGNVTTVAGISSDVTTVAGLESKMDTVIADASDIGTVAGNIGDVSTVAGISSDVDTVAGISADVTSVADNMADVQNATTSATNAATSAASASDSASAAATSAGTASSSASSASTSATNASNSATAASNSATAASSSASAASGSESAASGSASAAASSASAASTSASNAATSETNAVSSASAAATSATNAATSETNAAASATDSSNAASTWSNYYNTYVGASSSAPTVDVQGNALVAGALYFNTTNNTTYVWTGSAWNAVANNNIINPNVALTQDLATNGNDVKFGDNDKATFGAGDDLQIYHDGSGSYIDDQGTGPIRIRSGVGGALRFQDLDGDDLINAISNGAVTLYHNNSAKLATTSTGIDVTGTAVIDTTAGDLTIGAFGGSSVEVASTGAYKHSSNISSGYHLFEVNSKSVAKFNNSGDISFYEDTGTTPKLFWDASAESLGIGTSLPNDTLDINAGQLVNPNSTGSEITSATIGLGSNIHLEERQVTGAYVDRTDLAIVTNTGFGLGESEKVRIQASGNVGIGTDSPDAALEVNSGGGIHLSDHAVGRTLIIKPSLTGSIHEFTSDNTSAGYSFSNNSSELMRIDNAGRVGIGTSSPSAKLSVSNSGAGGLEFTPSYSGTRNLILNYNRSTSSYTAIDFDATDYIFYGSGSERMRIDASGNVGIGASSGDYKFRVTQSGVTQFILGYQGNSTNYLDGDTNIFRSGSGSERMRIDSSGNLLVGTTSTDPNSTAGAQLAANGRVLATVDGSNPGYFNRLTSDGELVRFEKDGTSVGSIGVGSGALGIGKGSGNLGLFDNFVVPMSTIAGGGSNGNITLGNSGRAFKDLYLSGGVYLGGTGAANKLDDYESGTFTPVFSFGGNSVGVTYQHQVGSYVKVGDLVTAQIFIQLLSKGTSTGELQVSGLPFTTYNLTTALHTFPVRLKRISYVGSPTGYADTNVSFLRIEQVTEAGVNTKLTNANCPDNAEIMITFTYRTN